jgi:hypothetical protein
MEAAACGIPQVAPDWAAMGELWRDFGLLTPVRDWRHAIDFATAHGEVSATETARRLAELYDGEAIRLLYAGRALDKAAMQLPWSTVAEAMGVLVERAIHEPSHPLSISEALASRRDPVHSVIHPSVWQ